LAEEEFMAVTPIVRGSKLATGINMFTLPRERHQALIETLTAINHEILTHKYPTNASANFHRGIDAPVVVNYNQYTDRAQGQFLRTQANVAPLMKRTHELSEAHEIRWYEVADVVTAAGPSDRIEIRDDRGNVGVIGSFTVAPERQGELLGLLDRYGQAQKTSGAPGFFGIATHRGYQNAHVASYEQWASADAYRHAVAQGQIADVLQQIRAMAEAIELHLFDVVSVTRFDA
jgi:heme-degrading monooxygenase HmoA